MTSSDIAVQRRVLPPADAPYQDMTLDEARNSTAIVCGCLGCIYWRFNCRVCNCQHIGQQGKALTYYAHIAVKLMADLRDKLAAGQHFTDDDGNDVGVMLSGHAAIAVILGLDHVSRALKGEGE